jgi:hypothetical protein
VAFGKKLDHLIEQVLHAVVVDEDVMRTIHSKEIEQVLHVVIVDEVVMRTID